MKIRNGFVSNSSSSSFVISTTNSEFKTVKELAKYMIGVLKEKYEDDYDKEVIKYNKKRVKTLEKNLKLMPDDNTPVMFNTCNYDTYIRKYGDQLFVCTCNNECWELYDYSTRASEESLKLLLDCIDYNRYKTEYGNCSVKEMRKYIEDEIKCGEFDYAYKAWKDWFSLDHGAYGYNDSRNDEFIKTGDLK